MCECTHNTTGDTCDRCLPLYNDKPWRYGETNNAYPCKMCDCNGHAESCHYNASVDPFPNSYDQGGGGVCDNCQSNTGGLPWQVAMVILAALFVLLLECSFSKFSCIFLYFLPSFFVPLSFSTTFFPHSQLGSTVRAVHLPSTARPVSVQPTPLHVYHVTVTQGESLTTETV